MKHAILLLATLLLAPAAIHAAERKPNILLILCDDLGYGDVHCLNPQRGKIATPHFDRLAAQGMIFTDAHSGSSVCTPTRYGILTGRYAWRTILQKGVLSMSAPALIAADRLTLPKLLKEHGYRTAGMGKWHLGWDVALTNGNVLFDQPIRNGPVTRGFDTYLCNDLRFESPFLFVENDRFAGTPLLKRTKLGAKFGTGTSLKPDDFAHILPTICDRAIARLEEMAHGKEPFFIYLAPVAPHDPYVPTPEWKGKSGLGVYADYVMETDFEIGRVLAALEKTGQADNSVVIFASDNGCAPYAGKKAAGGVQIAGSGYDQYLGVPGMEAKGHFPSASFRGYKSDIWDGGHRIPFIARWPGKIKPGTQSDQLICLTDLMASCADLVGAKLPDNAGEDSVNILPTLLGKANKSMHEAVVHHSIDGCFAIRQGQWKLELCGGSGGWSEPKSKSKELPGLPSVQLYDMTKDVGERVNEYKAHPEIVERLMKLLQKYIADGRSTPGAAQKNDAPIKLWKEMLPNGEIRGGPID